MNATMKMDFAFNAGLEDLSHKQDQVEKFSLAFTISFD